MNEQPPAQHFKAMLIMTVNELNVHIRIMPLIKRLSLDVAEPNSFQFDV